jgi:hypothetical protein
MISWCSKCDIVLKDTPWLIVIDDRGTALTGVCEHVDVTRTYRML